MQDLLHTLQDTDRGRLEIIAELWGLEPENARFLDMAQQLTAWMLDPSLAEEIYQSLPTLSHDALHDLQLRNGRMPTAEFNRIYGPLRNMGAGKRDRERPWRNPASAAETLWYHAFIARAFADDDLGPQEYIFVPEDLRSILPLGGVEEGGLPRPLPSAPPHIRYARTTTVDDASTILAGVRAGSGWRLADFLYNADARDMIENLLVDMGTLTEDHQRIHAETTRRFLQESRNGALYMLQKTWHESASFNDLAQIKHLLPPDEGWPNDPLATRNIYVSTLIQLPIGTWFEVSSLTSWFKIRQPSFQRPAGDFDSWYLRSPQTGEFMRGFEFWDVIDGALLESMTTKQLHWLGLVDLGYTEDAERPFAFRLKSGIRQFNNERPEFSPETGAEEQVRVRADGGISAPRTSNRGDRYQIARFSEWLTLEGDSYQYRVTLESLEAAADSGLTADHILKVLGGLENSELPPSLMNAIQRWQESGAEGQIKRWLVLEVQNPKVIDDLLAKRSTSRHLGERLAPDRILVDDRATEKLQIEAARLGLLIGIQKEE